MTLSKYTDNLYQSEVYRELERQAVKKGFFKPTDEELVKLAAQEIEITEKINRPIDTNPSNDLVQDVACLAYAMRRKGFINQAEDLEEKLVIYKRAENAFYNVTKETNADLIGFAHRDGDVNLIEGSGDLGAFETMQSISDKILAVIRKQPTGKQPTNKLAALASVINKVGQAHGSSGTWEEDGVVREIPKTQRAIISNAETTIQEFEAAKKNAPSLDNFFFSDLRNSFQQAAYVYFARLASIQVSQQAINSWYRVADVARKEGVLTEGKEPVVSTENLYNKLQNSRSLIPFAQTSILRNIANAISPEILAIFDSTYLNENNQSSYIFAGGLQVATNDQKSMAACQWLSQQARAVYVAAFGENNDTIAKAQSVMRSFPERLYSELATIKADEKVVDLNSALRQLVKIGRGIGDCLAKFSKEPTFSQMRSVNAGLVDQIVTWVNDMKSQIVSQYKSMKTADQTQPFSIEKSQLDDLESALEYWYKQSQSEDVDVAKRGANIASKIKQLQEVIAEYVSRPWVELQDALSDMGIDAPNKNVFLASVRQIADSAKGRK